MSMRRRLLLWLLTSLLAGGLAAAAVVFVQARSEAHELFDYQLRQLALTLRDRSYSVRQFAEVLQGEEALDFVIQVWAPDGNSIYESHPRLRIPGPVRLGFNDVTSGEGRWRVFAIQQRGLTLQVSQAVADRDALAFGAAWRTLLPFLVALPLFGLLIWRLVGREVRFLETTARAVASRSPESLAPLDKVAVPEEIQPLVDALNGLLGRLEKAFTRERQFIADAAHELRTPLTALRLQLQLAERARDDGDRERAYEMLREGIARAVRLVEQLLTLARQDPEASGRAREPVNLAALAREGAMALEAAATSQGLALAVEAPDPVEVLGDPAALRTMITNLVDNAIRYTPFGSVTVRVRREGTGGGVGAGSGEGGEAIFEVEDTGPGIPLAERQRVFDRFYRGEAATEGGTGLGLAIVRRIALRHGGAVELADGAGGRGLRVRFRMPMKNAP